MRALFRAAVKPWMPTVVTVGPGAVLDQGEPMSYPGDPLSTRRA